MNKIIIAANAAKKDSGRVASNNGSDELEYERKMKMKKEEVQSCATNDVAGTCNTKIESDNDLNLLIPGHPLKLRRNRILSAEEREIAVKAGLAELEKSYQDIAVHERDDAEQVFLEDFHLSKIPSVDILLHGDAILPQSMSAASRLLTLSQRMLGNRRLMLESATDILHDIYKQMLENYRVNGVDPRMPDSIPEFWNSPDPSIGFCSLEHCLPGELYMEVLWHLNDDSAPSEGNELFKNLKDLCEIVQMLLDLESLVEDYATICTLVRHIQGNKSVFNN